MVWLPFLKMYFSAENWKPCGEETNKNQITFKASVADSSLRACQVTSWTHCLLFQNKEHVFFPPSASQVHQKQQMARVESKRTATLSYTWQTPRAQRSNSPPGPISLRPRGQFVGSVRLQISSAPSVSTAVEAGATKREMKEARKSDGWKKRLFFLKTVHTNGIFISTSASSRIKPVLF